MVALDQSSWLFKLELLMRGIRVHPDGWGLRPGQKAPLRVLTRWLARCISTEWSLQLLCGIWLRDGLMYLKELDSQEMELHARMFCSVTVKQHSNKGLLA